MHYYEKNSSILIRPLSCRALKNLFMPQANWLFVEPSDFCSRAELIIEKAREREREMMITMVMRLTVEQSDDDDDDETHHCNGGGKN